MPELDGVDTTAIIRALPGEKYQKLPIVALTANVMGDVRDMFLESGALRAFARYECRA
jgi:CheY-like chemotaxis protein